MRSVLVQAGSFTGRRRMVRGFRRNAFSATRSDLLRAWSVSVRSRERSGVGCGPIDETVVERQKTHTCQLRDERENALHSIWYPFIKISE
jgi:hypothetical protein